MKETNRELFLLEGVEKKEVDAGKPVIVEEGCPYGQSISNSEIRNSMGSISDDDDDDDPVKDQLEELAKKWDKNSELILRAKVGGLKAMAYNNLNRANQLMVDFGSEGRRAVATTYLCNANKYYCMVNKSGYINKYMNSLEKNKQELILRIKEAETGSKNWENLSKSEIKDPEGLIFYLKSIVDDASNSNNKDMKESANVAMEAVAGFLITKGEVGELSIEKKFVKKAFEVFYAAELKSTMSVLPEVLFWREDDSVQNQALRVVYMFAADKFNDAVRERKYKGGLSIADDVL